MQVKASELRKILKGKFFTVTFTKKNGEVRKMLARCGVKKHLSGGSMSYDAYSKNHLPVYDLQKKAYRVVNCDTIKKLKCGDYQI